MWHTYNPWGDIVSWTIFKMKGQGHTHHSKFLPCLLFSSVRPYFTNSLDMRCTYNASGKKMLHTIFWSKVKVTRVIWNFCRVRSVASSLVDRITYNNRIHSTHERVMCCAPFLGRKAKGQGHAGHFKFWPCLLRGSIPIWLNLVICGIHTTNKRTMCCATFSDWKIKG